VSTRTLLWDGCVNVRDLGGHPTEDGGETRVGAIVRADSVRQLSEEGWDALVDYGIRTVVDLRLHSELEADPPHEPPVELVHVSLFPELDSPHWVEIDAITRATPDHVVRTQSVYLEFLTRFHESFAVAVRAIADARPGGVLVHCQAGKDRTGLLCALLLRLAGVSAEDVADDYALSEENLRAQTEQWVSEADDEAEREWRRRVSATPAEAMLGTVQELERRYGGVREYLLAGGASEHDVDGARARLR